MLKNPMTLIALLTATASPVLAAPPNVVTDIPAVGSLAQLVIGDLAPVHVLLPAGASAHHHQLKPSDARALQQADLLFWVGPELTPWLERAASDRAADSVVGLLAHPGTTVQGFGAEQDHDHGHGDEDGHEDGSDQDHAEPDDHADHADHAEPAAQEDDGHGHDGPDPHAWLDPQNGIAWTRAIAETLAARDPENAALYAANAAEAIARIETADAALQARLEPAQGKQFVVFHDAYGYFTTHFGLAPAIAVSLGDASSPSAAHLAELRDRLTAEQVVCAFPEAQHSATVIDSVVEGTDIRIGETLDPSGSAHPSGPDLYTAILDSMGAALADCLTAE